MGSQEGVDIPQEALEFAVFCIENLAIRLQRDAGEVYTALTKKSDILYDYILPSYDTLHTQGKEYILEDIQNVMEKRGVSV